MGTPDEDRRYLMVRQISLEQRLEQARDLARKFRRPHEAKAKKAADEVVRLIEIELAMIEFTIQRGRETGRIP